MKKLTKEMHAFLSPGSHLPLLLIPEYSGINKEQRIHDRSETAHSKPPVKGSLTGSCYGEYAWAWSNKGNIFFWMTKVDVVVLMEVEEVSVGGGDGGEGHGH